MDEPKSNRFTKYFPLLLDALRSVDPTPMRPAEVRAWIMARMAVPPEDLTRLIVNGKQSIFENDVHWARFYLAKAGLVSKPKRGLWGLTPEGRAARLTPEETWVLYVRIRDANRPGASRDEQDVPAPEIEDNDAEDGVSYWFVAAIWPGTDDQMPRFFAEGVWENGYSEEKFSPLVRCVKPGDRIAIRKRVEQKRGLPFNVGGKPVSGMRIKATGTVIENLNDGRTVKVAWDPPFEPRDWYFYAYRYRTTIVEADLETEAARRLVDFTFRGKAQDYAWFLAQPYWVEKYGAVVGAASPVNPWRSKSTKSSSPKKRSRRTR